MTLDRSKLAVWIVVLALVAGGLVLRKERNVPDTPQAPLPPVTVTVTPPLPPAPPPPPPVVATPKVVVKPVVKPVAKPVKPVIKPHKKRPVNTCSVVPKQAYQHDVETVVSFARARGVDDAGIVKLRACIAAHGAR